MNNESFIDRLEKLPVPILPTMVGVATLSNVYLTLGYTWIRHISMWLATIIVVLYTVKIFTYFKTFKKEYSNTILCSLYAGFTMVLMILGSYFFDYSAIFGKTLWFIGLIAQAIHILIFTYNNVIKGVNKNTFVPSWFVTYNGIMVSTVVGGVMKEPLISKIVVYYGIAVFVIILPFMLYRLFVVVVEEPVYHTQAIILAPSSLCLVSYLNVIQEPNLLVVNLLYIAVFCSLVFVIIMLPRFLSFNFTPAFAGLTFPMAIGTVASIKMATFLEAKGYNAISIAIKEISGIQIYVTTAIIAFVFYNFLKMLRKLFLAKTKV